MERKTIGEVRRVRENWVWTHEGHLTSDMHPRACLAITLAMASFQASARQNKPQNKHKHTAYCTPACSSIISASFHFILLLPPVGPAHRIHHLPAQLHGRGEGLGVAPKDIPKVNVKQAAVRAQEQVVQMSVSGGEGGGGERRREDKAEGSIHV